MMSVLNKINTYNDEMAIGVMKQVDDSILTPLLSPTYADHWRQSGALGRAWANLQQGERLGMAKKVLMGGCFALPASCLALSLQSFVRQNSHFSLFVLGAVASGLWLSCSVYVLGAGQPRDVIQIGSKREVMEAGYVVGCYVLCIPASLLLSMVDPWNSAARAHQWIAWVATCIALVMFVSRSNLYMVEKGCFAKIEWENTTNPLLNLAHLRESAHASAAQFTRRGIGITGAPHAMQEVQNDL